MSNQQQNKIQNEIEQIRREIDLLQDRLKKNEIQNEIEQIRRKINLLQDRFTKK